MSKIPMTVKDKDAWLLLKELDEHGEGLTQWEVDFVESTTQHLLAGGKLTEAQARKLDQVREERL